MSSGAESSSDPIVEMYTKTFCWYCRAARRLLDDKGVDYLEINLDEQPDRREEMIERSSGTTVPQIFIRGQAIGGHDEMKVLDEQGVLDTLLLAAAASMAG